MKNYGNKIILCVMLVKMSTRFSKSGGSTGEEKGHRRKITW